MLFLDKFLNTGEERERGETEKEMSERCERDVRERERGEALSML